MAETERLQAEIKRLKEVIERTKSGEDETFKDLFNNSTDLIYILDERYKFIDVNKAVMDHYGYAKDEIIGQEPSLFAAPDMNDMAEVLKAIDKVWNEGATIAIEWWGIKKDRSIFLKDLVLRKGKYFGRDVIVATGRDITERKEVENKLIQKNEELKNLNEALDAFVYGASHDLKSPLLSLKGLIELMESDDKEDKTYYFERIKQSLNKLTNFVDDLVDYSRNTRTEVKSEKIDFENLIATVLDNFKFLPGDDQVRKIIEIDLEEDFCTDQNRLYIILNNLISNALRYYDESKEDPYIKILVRVEAGEAVITIEDNGIGIEEKHLEKMFQMFYRGTDKRPGSGLGLYIVKETIAKLNGKISYHSEYTKGTTFVVRIPDCNIQR